MMNHVVFNQGNIYFESTEPHSYNDEMAAEVERETKASGGGGLRRRTLELTVGTHLS